MNQLNGYDVEDLRVGMSASFSKTITEADLVLFAGVSGDNNAMHVNEEFAAATPFGGRIAHGMLTASVISAAIANKMPGPGMLWLTIKRAFGPQRKLNDELQCGCTLIPAQHPRVCEINTLERRRHLFAERSLVSHAELATRNSKRTPSRRCAVAAGWALFSFVSSESIFGSNVIVSISFSSGSMYSNSSGISRTWMGGRLTSRNRVKIQSLCSLSIAKTISAHRRSSSLTRRLASDLTPADRTSRRASFR